MSDPEDIEPPEVRGETAAASRPNWRRRMIRGAAYVVASVIALLVAAVFLLDTSPGRRLVADLVRSQEFENGMRIEVGRIEGSLYGRMVLHDLSVKDPQGEFLYSPEVHVDWRPFAYLVSHIDIRSATAQRMMLRRLPEFRDTPPSDEPLLPDLDIDIGTLRIDSFIAEKAVSGTRRIAKIEGEAHIADGRAQIHLLGEAQAVSGKAGGDRLAIDLDAVPEQGRLAVAIDLRAPRGGVLAALAGFDEPLSLKVEGKGDWRVWNGLFAGEYGGSELARLRLSARDGTFAIKGSAHLGMLFEGATAELFTPVVNVDMSAALKERRADISGGIGGDAFNLNAKGLIDLSDNSFEGLNLDFSLLRPSVLAANLRGQGLHATLALDGPFAAPKVDYAIDADRIQIGGVGLERFAANGNARVDAERILIPVKASARRIIGLDTAAGGALANVRLTGDIAIDGGRALSDNMRLRSNRIDAKAVLLANLETGLYTGAIDGRIATYRLESVGIFAVDADADLEAGKKGFALDGRVRARSTKLLNDTLGGYLGGNFVAASDVRYATDGTVTLANLRLEAPDLRIVGGSGLYSPDGRIKLVADGTSQRHGELGVRIAGTITSPDAHITAERPDLGIGLANLDARITGAKNGYRLDLTAETDYGPLTADVILGTRGATTLRIAEANLSGIDFAGTLTQTKTGPFKGELTASGNGLGGIVRLDAEGRYQQVMFNLRARNTVFRGAAGLAIGSAIVDGKAVLYDQPEVVADVQLANTRLGGFTVNAARALVDYREGRGHAKALLEGTRGAPFRLAVNGTMEPGLWRIMLDGKTRGISFKTTSPARILPRDGSYELLPSRIVIGDGNIRLSGSYGDGMTIRSRLERIDLALVNAFIPGMGIGGKATGSLDFRQASPNAFPRADARLVLEGFTRTSAATVSRPVDINFAGKLLADGGEARAVIRQRGSVIGRMQATLGPLSQGNAPWTERLMQAPLAGGVRYNGPAETLFSFAAEPGQTLSGPLGIAADFSCRVKDPCLNGVVHGKGMTYTNQQYGTKLTKLDVNGRFSDGRLEIEELQAKAGSGTVKGSGYLSLAAGEGYPIDIALTLDKARLARSDAISTSATGELRLTKAAGETALLSGQLRLPETRYKIVREGAAEVPRLSGVRFRPKRGVQRVSGEEQAEPAGSLLDLVRLDVDVASSEKLYVSGMGLESEWRAKFTVGGTTVEPTMTGSVSLIRGTLDFAGRAFKLTEGQVSFNGGRVIDPRIRIVATEDVEDVAVNVNVGGRASSPLIAFTSTPSLPQDEIMSRILFGSSIANLSAFQAVQLATSLNSLRGSNGGLNPLGKLRSATGVDRLRILGEDEEAGRGTAVAAGKYLTDDIYVELITDTRGFTATQLEVSITPWLSVLSEAGGSGANSVSLKIKKNY